MKIRGQREKRTFIIIALCTVLVLMGVGYAAFSSLLTINGTASTSNSWCVGFDITKTNTYKITKGLETGTEPTGIMNYSGNACEINYKPNASLASAFYQPGDEIEYTLTIKNKSSVTAAIKSLNINSDQNVVSTWTNTIGNFTYTVNMPEDKTLDPNEETTMTVIAKFQDETPIEGKYTGETQNLNIFINVEQDDGEGGFTPSPVSNKFTGTIYRKNGNILLVGETMEAKIEQKWCDIDKSSGNQYDCFDTETECNTLLQDYGYTETDICELRNVSAGGVGEYTEDPSTLGTIFYLKHDVVDDIVTTAYGCFILDGSEYCMKGGDNGESYATNKALLQSLESKFDRCSYEETETICRNSSFESIKISNAGNVHITKNSYGGEECWVSDNKQTGCVN